MNLCKSLEVGNLHPDVTEEMLQDMFEAIHCTYVNTTNLIDVTAHIVRDADGLSMGYGFVDFTQHNAAELAYRNFTGKLLLGQVLLPGV